MSDWFEKSRAVVPADARFERLLGPVEVRALMALVLGSRLCPVCRRGYRSRKKRLGGVCPNPRCGGHDGNRNFWSEPRFGFLRPGAPLPMEAVTVERWASFPFCLAPVVVSPEPDDGTFYVWRRVLT